MVAKKKDGIRFFSYAQYKKCFEWATQASEALCNVLHTSDEDQFLTKYGQQICLKQE